MNRLNQVIYKALGFPIIILDPKYIEFEGESILDVNPRNIMEGAFRALIEKTARLSGAEVKFMRTYMELTQDVFGRLVGVDGSTVTKWEAKDLESTKMDLQTEVLLRSRCKLYLNSRDRVGNSFFDNLFSRISGRDDVGEPITVSAA